MVQSANDVEVLHISDALAEAGQNIYTQSVTPAETLASYDDRALAEAYDLSCVANQRRSGRERGAYKLLAIDSLDDLYRQRDAQVEAYLLWLISDGPAQGISVAAACSPEFPIRAPGWASPFARTMQASGGGLWRYNYNGEYHEVRA